MKTTPASVLVVDDETGVCDALAESLRSFEYRPETANSYGEAVRRLSQRPFQTVLCDVQLADRTGFDLLDWIEAHKPQTPVILVTGFGTVDSALQAIRYGACDYLSKPVRDDELRFSVERALRNHNREEDKLPNPARDEEPPFSGERTERTRNPVDNKELDRRFPRRLAETVVGRDPKMLTLFDTIRRVAESRTTVLILGESGTGKTMTARLIHQLSPRHGKAFVEVACGTLPDALLESELFGHIAGAFTGAERTKPGRFLQADGGTLFLDEVAMASPSLQVKLLRVLQDGEFEPVGSAQTHKVDARLVLATNQDPEELVEQGRFRKDLYYRINVITLNQPPLRERIADLPVLIDHFLAESNRQTGKDIRGFDRAALDLMQRYDWPGNVRELINVIERAVVLTDDHVLTVEDLPQSLRQRAAPRAGGMASRLKHALSAPERQIIVDSLNRHGWNRQKTARSLGIDRTTLYKKMRKYRIESKRADHRIQ